MRTNIRGIDIDTIVLKEARNLWFGDTARGPCEYFWFATVGSTRPTDVGRRSIANSTR